MTRESNATCRIPNSDSNARTPHTAVSKLISQFAAKYRRWGTRSTRSRIPATYPKKVVAAGGSRWMSLDTGRCESGLENQVFSRLLDVYERLWMAPRTGFEMYRKLLSAPELRTSDELNTPSDRMRRRCNFACRRDWQRFEWVSHASRRRDQRMGANHRRADATASQAGLHATHMRHQG